MWKHKLNMKKMIMKDMFQTVNSDYHLGVEINKRKAISLLLEIHLYFLNECIIYKWIVKYF